MAGNEAMEQIQKMAQVGEGMNQGGSMLTQQVAAGAGATAMVLASHQRAMLQGRDLYVVQQNLVNDFQSWDKDDKGLYELKFGSTNVMGLSIRAAEQVQYRMGHLHSEGSMTPMGQDVLVAMSLTDLVTNTTVSSTQAVSGTVERKYQMDDRVLHGVRKNTKGETLYIYPATAQELVRDCQKAQSVLLRNCIMRVTPPHVRKAIFDTIKKANAAMFKTSKPQAIADIVAMGGKLRPSISAVQMSKYIGHSLEEMTSEEFVELRGAFKAIEEGAVTWADIVERREATDGVEPAVSVNTGDEHGAASVGRQPQNGPAGAAGKKQTPPAGSGLPGMTGATPAR
jgi:hypothetical protein